MDGWNTTFLLGRPIFRGYVSFREGSPISSHVMNEHLRTCFKITWIPNDPAVLIGGSLGLLLEGLKSNNMGTNNRFQVHNV